MDLANYLKRQARQTHRGEQLSPSGRILLQSLHLNGPQTVPSLAHVRSTSRQNIQVLVDRLADPDDGGATHVGRVAWQADDVDGVTYVSGGGWAQPGTLLRAQLTASEDYDFRAVALT